MKRTQNKRESKRQSCWVPVDGKKGTTFASAQTVDISKGGIGIISKRKIPLDEKIAVEIDTAPNSEPILVMGKVVWVRKMTDEDRYRVGLKFQKAFSAQAQQKLSKLASV